jgi:hypothetical protein
MNTGECTLAYWSKEVNCPTDLRGGSQLVQTNGALLGVAHRTRYFMGSERAIRNITTEHLYEHHFVRMDARPPFALRNVSPPFVFPRLFGTDAEWVQFGAGLAVEGGHAILTYGLGDCSALQVRLPARELFRLAG